MPHEARGERVGNLRRVDPVPVFAADGTESGMKAIRGPAGPQDRHFGPEDAVEASPEAIEVEARAVGGREGGHLPLGVDPGICAPGHGQLRFRSEDPAEGFSQDALDRSDAAALSRPAVEAGAVVRQIEPDDPGRYSSSGISSMSAIGAPSPWRWPSLRILV
jgi:hypothetical protein